MSQIKTRTGAGTDVLGFASNDKVSVVVLHVETMAGVSIQPKIRGIDSGGTYFAVGCKKRTGAAADTDVAVIAEVGVYAIDVAGCELELVFDDTATYSWTPLIG